MTKSLSRWFRPSLVDQTEYWHECELCGDLDDPSVHASLSTGEVVCWHCAEDAGEFKVPHEMEWRIGLAF